MPQSKVALSLLAHPDDAEFLCGGTLLRLREAGWEVHIASMTPGDCGSMEHNRWDIASIRTKENANAAKIICGDAANYHCMDERDLMVVYDKPAILKCIDLMRRVNPSLVITHAPRDYMMDHEMTSLLARGASFGFGAPNASTVPVPKGAHVPYLYYCDPVEGIDPLGQAPTLTTWIDVTKQTPKKTKALAAHKSQREWLRAHHGMDEYLESMRRQSSMRGKEIGVKYAEAFTQHRGHPYPKDDLLTKLLGKK
mgnify:FL=1